MAKGNGASKKLLAKKDMNFFAEFTASAAKAARLLTYAILFGAAVESIFDLRKVVVIDMSDKFGLIRPCKINNTRILL